MKISVSLFALLLASLYSQAQFFVQQLPQDQILNNDKAYVVSNQGDTVKGVIINGSILRDSVNGDLLEAFTIKTDEGKIKYKMLEIKTLGVIPGVGAKHKDMPLLTTLKRASDTTFLKAVETEWVIFERILLPGKREVYDLAQLVNPGFDSKIKVYTRREANDSGNLSFASISLTGGENLSHLVSINNERPIRVTKRKYQKDGYNMVFKDCDMLSQGKLMWKEFAKHIFVYDTKCE